MSETFTVPASAGRRRYVRQATGRAMGAVVDQSLSSLTNFVVLFAALRTLDVEDLGAFTLAYTGCLVVVALARALVLEPFTVRHTVASAGDRREAMRAATGASLMIGLGVVLVSLIAYPLLVPGSWRVLVASSLALAGLLVQDAWRVCLFAAGRAWAAAVNDGICLAATAVATVAVVRTSESTVAVLVLAWAAGTAAGGIFGARQLGVVPHPGGARSWFASNRDLGLRFAGEAGLERIAPQVSLMLVGAIAGLRAVGELGAARTIMSPATTVTTSATIFAGPEAARLRSTHPHRLFLFSLAVSAVLAAAVLGFTLAALAAPDSLGRSIAGDNWSTATSLLVPVGLWTAAAAARQGPRVSLRAMERPAALLQLALVTAPLVVLSSSVGAAVAGGRGAAWAFAGTYAVSALLRAVTEHRVARQLRRPPRKPG